MRRRDLLVAAGTGLGGIALRKRGRAGSDGRLERDASDAADSTIRTDDDRDDRIVVGDPESVAFPDANPPHELEIRNERGEATVSITIEADREETVLDREIDLRGDETLAVILVEPRAYESTLTVASGGSETTVTDGIAREPFDCTQSKTTVTLREGGVSTESSSRTTPCPEPTVAGQSLERGAENCLGADDGGDATVQFADAAVVVDGAIETPTPCHEIDLAGASYDADRDVLEVEIAVGEGGDDVCVQCLGVVEYEAHIDLEGRYPGRVEVVHERGDETVTVADATYGEADD